MKNVKDHLEFLFAPFGQRFVSKDGIFNCYIIFLDKIYFYICNMYSLINHTIRVGGRGLLKQIKKPKFFSNWNPCSMRQYLDFESILWIFPTHPCLYDSVIPHREMLWIKVTLEIWIICIIWNLNFLQNWNSRLRMAPGCCFWIMITVSMIMNYRVSQKNAS